MFTPYATPFKACPNAASETVIPVFAAALLTVPDCTIAPLPFVPDVSTPVHSPIAHAHTACVSTPKSIVTAPVVGDATMPRNRVVRYVVVPDSRLTVATCTHVIPLPVSVGVDPCSGWLTFATHARISLDPPGLILAVANDVAGVVSLPEVRPVAEMPVSMAPVMSHLLPSAFPRGSVPAAVYHPAVVELPAHATHYTPPPRP